MASASDLMNLGIPAPVAQVVGGTPVTVTGSGTAAAQASATTIPPFCTPVYIAAATAGVAATVFSTACPTNVAVLVVNNATASAVTASVFCPVGGTMNGTSNGSVVLTTGKSAIFMQTGASIWVSTPLTP